MPMPHRTFAQVAKRRLVGKEGRERIREVRALLAELPDYRNGPYADLRKSLLAEIEDTRTRSSRGPPRLDRRPSRGRGAGRARRAAQRRQVVAAPGAVGDPDPDGRLRVHHAPAGAGADADRRRARPAGRDPGPDRGRERGPRRRAGAARRAPLRRRDRLLRPRRRRPRGSSGSSSPRSPRPRSRSRRSSPRPGRTRPPPGAVDALAAAVPGLAVLPVSVLDEASLDGVPRRGLAAHRADPRPAPARTASTDEEPLALHPPATVVDVADAVHHELADACTGARVWGPSARFDGPARRPRPRGRRRRRRRGARLTGVDTARAACLISIPIDMYRR